MANSYSSSFIFQSVVIGDNKFVEEFKVIFEATSEKLNAMNKIMVYTQELDGAE